MTGAGKFKNAWTMGSIGIIGGADGPVSVFISKSGSPWVLVVPAVIVLVAGGIAIVLALKVPLPQKVRRALFVLSAILDIIGAALLAAGIIISGGK